MNTTTKTKAGNRIAQQSLLASLLLLLSLPLLFAHETASSIHYRLDGGFCPASGQSFSASFQLTGSLAEGVAGFAASRSYRVLADRIAFIPNQGIQSFWAMSACQHPPGSNPAASAKWPRISTEEKCPAVELICTFPAGAKTAQK